MPSSAWPWVIGAGIALIAGAAALWGRWPAPWKRPAAGLIAVGLALLAAITGIAWRAWEARAWPGASPADALTLLAGGGLAALAWWMAGAGAHYRAAACRAVFGATMVATAALLGVAAAIAPAWPAAPLAFPARTWLFGLRSLLAAIGLGGWLPALAASSIWRLRTVVRLPAAAPAGAGGLQSPLMAPEAARPAEDPGRSAARLSMPWLTAACLASGAWNMTTSAAIHRGAAADLWLLAAWLLAGAYLHLTSSWRPLRLPGWLSPLVAAGVFAAAALAASTAGSLR